MSQEEVEIQTSSEYVTCPVCQQLVKAKGKYGHFKTAHLDLNYEEYRNKFTPAPAPTPPEEEIREKKPEEEAREEPLYKGELDTTAILREILKKHPDIPSKVVDEICSWTEYGPIHPTQLVYLLSSMRGINTTTANIVAQKYSLALQKAAAEAAVSGKMQPPFVLYAPTPQPQPQQLMPFGYSMPFYQEFTPQFPVQVPEMRYQMQVPAPTPMPTPAPARTTLPSPQPTAPSQMFWPSQPWYAPQPQPSQAPSITEDRIRSIIREEMERGKVKEAEAYVDIEDPARDHEGNVILGANDKPIMKRIRVPASQAGLFAPKEDPEMKILQKMELYRKIFGKEGPTEAQIRDIIRQEMPKTSPKPETPPITAEDVKKAAVEAADSAIGKFIEMHEKEDREEKRHRELLSAIQSSTSAKAVEGYREDSYRILGQGLSEFASFGREVCREKKPAEILAREVVPVLLGHPKEVKQIKEKVGESRITDLLPVELVESPTA